MFKVGIFLMASYRFRDTLFQANFIKSILRFYCFSFERSDGYFDSLFVLLRGGSRYESLDRNELKAFMVQGFFGLWEGHLNQALGLERAGQSENRATEINSEISHLVCNSYLNAF